MSFQIKYFCRKTKRGYNIRDSIGLLGHVYDKRTAQRITKALRQLNTKEKAKGTP